MRVTCAGTWRIPVTRRVRTANLETYEEVAAALNDQVTAPSVLRADDAPSCGAGAPRAAAPLRITVAPDVARFTGAPQPTQAAPRP